MAKGFITKILQLMINFIRFGILIHVLDVYMTTCIPPDVSLHYPAASAWAAFAGAAMLLLAEYVCHMPSPWCTNDYE